MIPAGWRQEGHSVTKKLLQFLFIHGYLWMTTNIIQPILPCGQLHLPTRNRTMGNPAKLQDGVPVIMKVIDLMPCREAGGGRKNTSNVPDCIRFATWNIGNMSGRSAEVVETLHRRKIDVCCVQETRWTGSGARVMGKGMSRYKFFWQGCKDGNGLLFSDRWIDRIIDMKRVNECIMCLKVLMLVGDLHLCICASNR